MHMNELEITYGQGLFIKEIITVESDAVIYSKLVPGDLVETGKVIELSDFHDGAESVGLAQRVGTSALKTTVLDLSGSIEPFIFARRLNASGNSICTSYGYTDVKLKDFYIKTQSLFDYYSEINAGNVISRQTKNGKAVIAAVLFDHTSKEL